VSVQYRQLWAPAVGLSGSFSCCFLVLAFGIAKALCIPPTLQCLVIRHMAASMVETETAEMVTVVTETQTAGTTTTTTAEGKAAVEKVHVMGATGKSPFHRTLSGMCYWRSRPMQQLPIWCACFKQAWCSPSVFVLVCRRTVPGLCGVTYL